MKKYFYFLAIAVLFAACQPNNDLGTPFQKGQKVTLSATIANPDGGAKQMPGKQRVSGLDDTPSDPTNGAIKLTWNEGDQIKVTVNGQSATFTLKEGYGGSSTGEFEGTMPADGNSYTVTYPVEAPALTTQTYVENGFGEGLMAMSGEGTLEEGFILTATNALLGLQLTGSKALSDIVVTNNQGGTYTLNCAGVTLKDEATLFYIVVPAGTWANGFKVEVLQDDKSLISDFEKTSSATFTPNQAMVMPTKVADYDLKTLTFEDWTNEADKSFEPYDLYYGDYPTITTWSDLIDGTQYGGALLYGYYDMSEFPSDDDIENRTFYSYYWCDENNTVLKHRINSTYGYMAGGIAISNYTCLFDEISTYGDFYSQLTVLNGGNNASSNFCAVNAMGGMMGGTGVIMSFGDEKARIIDHLYVNNTTYGLNTYLYGEGNYCPAPQNGEKVKIIATPTDEYGEVISDAETSEFYLCDGPNNVVQDWTKWDLSKLGKVYGLAFSIEGYSYAVPYVFAIDDIAVRFPKE
jgi:hypothetical protein